MLTSNGLDIVKVVRRSLAELQGDGALGGRSPLDEEGLAGDDGLGSVRAGDGVLSAGGSKDDGGESGEEGGGGELHFGCLLDLEIVDYVERMTEMG
jgi:hypothetical protein